VEVDRDRSDQPDAPASPNGGGPGGGGSGEDIPEKIPDDLPDDAPGPGGIPAPQGPGLPGDDV
jgi:hypothetical protein